MSINFNIRMEEELKERAFPVIERYGLTPAQAVKLFLRQIADTQTIPLTLNHHATPVPNALTRAAIAEARAGGGEVYDSVEEALAALKALGEEPPQTVSEKS